MRADAPGGHNQQGFAQAFDGGFGTALIIQQVGKIVPSFRKSRIARRPRGSLFWCWIAVRPAVIEISPNDLFGVSARINSEVSQLSSWAMKTALKLQELAPAARQSVDTIVEALPKRR